MRNVVVVMVGVISIVFAATLWYLDRSSTVRAGDEVRLSTPVRVDLGGGSIGGSKTYRFYDEESRIVCYEIVGGTGVSISCLQK